MDKFNLRTMMRNRLKIRRKTAASFYYMAELKRKYPHLDLEHILGSIQKRKLNDFLLCQLDHETHMKIENGVEVEGCSFEEMLLVALENLMDGYEELFEELLKYKDAL